MNRLHYKLSLSGLDLMAKKQLVSRPVNHHCSKKCPAWATTGH